MILADHKIQVILKFQNHSKTESKVAQYITELSCVEMEIKNDLFKLYHKYFKHNILILI